MMDDLRVSVKRANGRDKRNNGKDTMSFSSVDLPFALASVTTAECLHG